MSAIRHKETLAVGVDLGGTRIRVAAYVGERARESWVANAPTLGELLHSLGRRWKRRGWRRSDVGALVVASRAVWTPAERRHLARRLAPLARRVQVISDAEAALLGALDGAPGVLIVAGTGSIAVGRDGRGRVARAGGLGPLLGDEGSAFWLGREWLRATARRGNEPVARRFAHAAAPVATIATLAPTVIRRARRGDPVARMIVAAGQQHLAAIARQVARALRLHPPVAVSWTGGVLDDPWFRSGVRRALRRAGLDARWHVPAAPPVAAAARLATRLAARQGKER